MKQLDLIEEHHRELAALTQDVLRWPPGDKKSQGAEYIVRAARELSQAEGERERGRDIGEHIERVRDYIDKIFKL